MSPYRSSSSACIPKCPNHCRIPETASNESSETTCQSSESTQGMFYQLVNQSITFQVMVSTDDDTDSRRVDRVVVTTLTDTRTAPSQKSELRRSIRINNKRSSIIYRTSSKDPEAKKEARYCSFQKMR